MKQTDRQREPVVITGIGLVTAVGDDREATWQAIREGRCGMRWLTGLLGIEDGTVIGAPVEVAEPEPNRLKVITLAHRIADEALADAHLDLDQLDKTRIGCAACMHMGDTSWIVSQTSRSDAIPPHAVPWWEQFFPSSQSEHVALRLGLRGPRVCHAAACASGTIDIITAARTIQCGDADVMLAGGADAIHPLFVAGFKNMRALAQSDDPQHACRPFDVNRNGFVMGEGGAFLVLERLSHALDRGARIYAEIASTAMVNETYHVTGLDEHGEGLPRLIQKALRRADLAATELDYINAHGTGTQQNDLAEAVGIRKALGRQAFRVPASATKSMIGHLVNASGPVELAITALALRDGFIPPTINLTDPDPRCELEHVPLVGRRTRPQTALKLSVAFGGHMAAVVLHRWNDAASGLGEPERVAA